MAWPNDEPLYSSGEVLYECQKGVRWFWILPSGRIFAWCNGVLEVKVGERWVLLSRQPTWQAGIQFSCGFEAGRTLLPLGSRGDV